MLFARIRRAGALAGLVAAFGLAAPVGASAAVPGQPTAVTISPQFPETVARGSVGLPQATGVQVAQERRRLRNQRASSRRQFRRQSTARRAQVNRGRRPAVRRNYGPNRRTAYRRGYRAGARRYYGGRWYTYRGNDWYDDGGSIVAAGVIGLAAGALVGSAYSNTRTVVVNDYDYGYGAPYSSGWYRACSNKYRSFRASDGTYLGYDGLRHTCRIP